MRQGKTISAANCASSVGSISLVTSSSGAVLKRLAYEAFGKRRFPNGADDPGNTIMGLNTERGTCPAAEDGEAPKVARR